MTDEQLMLFRVSLNPFEYDIFGRLERSRIREPLKDLSSSAWIYLARTYVKDFECLKLWNELKKNLKVLKYPLKELIIFDHEAFSIERVKDFFALLKRWDFADKIWFVESLARNYQSIQALGFNDKRE